MSIYFRELPACIHCGTKPEWQRFRQSPTGGLNPQANTDHTYRLACRCAVAKVTVHGDQDEHHTTAIDTLITVYNDGVFVKHDARSDTPSKSDSGTQTSAPSRIAGGREAG